jgi:hypothetical protein
MKILFVVPGGNDLGGIITSTEQYVAGLKEAGHEVNFMTVGFGRSGTRRDRSPRGKFENDFSIGEGTGVLMHPTQGWRGEQRMSLMNEAEREAFIHIGKKHDIVIWASIYGFRNPDTENRAEWFAVIKALKGKHVFFIHDDHLPERYPWAYALAPYARCFIGVQPCSYDSLADVAAPRSMVYTPLPPLPKQIAPLDQRKGFFMCQVWKGWKNGHKLVAAAAQMPKGSVTFAGDGIQLRYMRSPTKCPPRFAGLWDAAIARQKYVGVLQEEERDAYLQHAKFLVDLSLRYNSGQYNRIAQEAMAQGCVVIADPRFITGTGDVPLFKPNVHYIPIDASMEPEQIANHLKAIHYTHPSDYARIQKEARKVLQVFDRKRLATYMVTEIELAKQRKCKGVSGKDQFYAVFGELP